MARRFISLYWASLTGGRALRALAGALRYVGRGDAARAQLARAVQAQLGEHAVFATGSGRSALALCLRAAGIGAGDEVLLSAYSCLAVPTGVLAAGATPVYADVDPDTLNLDVETVRAALTPRVRALVVQHTLGKPAPVPAIVEMARARGILVIEDCALSPGAELGGRQVGTFGDAAIFSMELSKTLSCGWGGLLLVSDATLAAAVQRVYAALPAPPLWVSLRDLLQTGLSAWSHHPARLEGPGKYVLYGAFRLHLFRRSTPAAELEGRIAPSFLRKMGAPQACLARLQWLDFPRVTAACDANARELRRALVELQLAQPGAPAANERSVAPRVSFLTRDRAGASAFFRARGVELGEWFDGPMSPLPASPRFNYFPGSYPNAEAVAALVVNVPCHSRLSPEDLRHVVSVVREYAQVHGHSLIRSSGARERGKPVAAVVNAAAEHGHDRGAP